MLDLLHTPNRWFDRLPDTRRFLVFFFPMLVILVVTEVWPLVGYPLLLVIGLYRWHWLHRTL